MFAYIRIKITKDIRPLLPLHLLNKNISWIEKKLENEPNTSSYFSKKYFINKNDIIKNINTSNCCKSLLFNNEEDGLIFRSIDFLGWMNSSSLNKINISNKIYNCAILDQKEYKNMLNNIILGIFCLDRSTFNIINKIEYLYFFYSLVDGNIFDVINFLKIDGVVGKVINIGEYLDMFDKFLKFNVNIIII